MRSFSDDDSINIAIKKLWIFDFDGVLLDSVGVKTAAFGKMYSHYGENIQAKVVEYHEKNGGMSRFDKFRHFESNVLGMEVSEREIEHLSEKFSNIVLQDVIDSPEVQGADKVLEFCEKNGHICAIASATPERELNTIVTKKGWQSKFASALGSPATKSENITKLIHEYSMTPRQTIFSAMPPMMKRQPKHAL